MLNLDEAHDICVVGCTESQRREFPRDTGSHTVIWVVVSEVEASAINRYARIGRVIENILTASWEALAEQLHALPLKECCSTDWGNCIIAPRFVLCSVILDNLTIVGWTAERSSGVHT